MDFRARKHPHGFTLFEMLIVLAVLAILAALGATGLESTLARRQLDRAASEIARGVQLTRSEAAKRGAPVRFMFNDDDDWSAGWQVVADVDRDGDYDDAAIFQGESANADIVITPTDDNDLTSGYLEFTPQGAVTPISDRLVFSVEDNYCNASQTIIVSVTANGEVNRETAAC